MSERAYWDLELELADIAYQIGLTRAGMFERPFLLTDKQRQRVICIILAQKKILKDLMRPAKPRLRLVGGEP